MDKIKHFEPFFGEWYAESFIGAGSFGRVYKIYREELGNQFYSALKYISVPAESGDIMQLRMDGMDNESISTYYTDMARDISSEITLMNKLRGNTNIVSFEDSKIIPKPDGMGYDIFIRMELLQSLTARMVDSPLTKAETVKLGIDICNALVRCKKNGIIHRDIKPDNIFISEDGDFKLGDFGIARQLEKTATFMSKKGTYNYMAPEVYKGEKYGATCDLYSLGLVMYRLLNKGRLPFLPAAPKPITSNDREQSLQQRFQGKAIPAPCDADEELSSIILKACAFNVKDRFATAEEMSDALTRYSIGEHGIVPVAPVADFDRTHDDTDETQGVFGTSNGSKADDGIDPNATSGVFSNSVKSKAKPETEDNFDKTHGAFAVAAIPVAAEAAEKASTAEAPKNAAQQPKISKNEKPTKKRPWWIIGIAAALALTFGLMAVLGVFSKNHPTSAVDADLSTPIPVSSDETTAPATQNTETAVSTTAETALPTISSTSAPADWSEWVDSLPSSVNNQGYEIEQQTLYSYRTIETTSSTTNSSMPGWELYDTRTANGDYGPWSDWSQTKVEESNTRDIQTETRYHYRDKETTTSDQPSLNGWTLENTTYSWGDYGSWSSWSTSPAYNSDSRQVDSKTQYSYRTKSYTTSSSSSLSGWTQYDHQISYGSWSSWQDDYIAESSNIEVQTRQVQIGTRYHMGHYCIWDHTYWNNQSADEYFNANCILHDLGWFNNLNNFHLCSDNDSQTHPCYYYNGTSQSNCYWCSNRCFRFYVLEQENVYKTQYRYRTISHTYYYYQWSDWSDWSDSYVSENSDRQVHTRTLYRYRDRQQIPTYHFYRWGEWSPWSSTTISQTSARQVDTATFYRYRDKVTVTTYYFKRWSDWSDYSATVVNKSDTVDVRTKTRYRYKPKS